MIPKRQHMEQTTEGTISYLLSISWSHFSPTSAKPNSWLVDVMLTEVKGGQLLKELGWGVEGMRQDDWISGPHPLKRGYLQTGRMNGKSNGEREGE